MKRTKKKRQMQPGAVYHFIARFVESRWFIGSDHERRVYLQLLGDGLARSDWRCFGYAIMSNHIHLALVAGETTLASWLREVHRQFAQWTNERRDRIGAVFVRGPAMHWMRPDAAKKLLSYIHHNPVRAGLAWRPGDSDWTSHRAYVGLDEERPWLDTQLGLQLCGVSDGAALDALFEDEELVRREQLEEMRLDRKRRGRPRKSATATASETPTAGATATASAALEPTSSSRVHLIPGAPRDRNDRSMSLEAASTSPPGGRNTSDTGQDSSTGAPAGLHPGRRQDLGVGDDLGVVDGSCDGEDLGARARARNGLGEKTRCKDEALDADDHLGEGTAAELATAAAAAAALACERDGAPGGEGESESAAERKGPCDTACEAEPVVRIAAARTARSSARGPADERLLIQHALARPSAARPRVSEATQPRNIETAEATERADDKGR